MTKAKKFMYRIQYNDNTYQVVDWTKYEFEKVGEYMEAEAKAIKLEEGLFRLTDVRAVIFFPPPPPPTEKEKLKMKEYGESQLSEWGFVDQETAEWLKANGIDLQGGDK